MLHTRVHTPNGVWWGTGQPPRIVAALPGNSRDAEFWRESVAMAAHAGADAVRLGCDDPSASQAGGDAWRVVVETAHRLGLSVVAHATSFQQLNEVLVLGIDVPVMDVQVTWFDEAVRRMAESTPRPVLLTGRASRDAWDLAVGCLRRHRRRFLLSFQPKSSDLSQLKLFRIPQLAERYRAPVLFVDSAASPVASSVAVALGAAAVEWTIAGDCGIQAVVTYPSVGTGKSPGVAAPEISRTSLSVEDFRENGRSIRRVSQSLQMSDSSRTTPAASKPLAISA